MSTNTKIRTMQDDIEEAKNAKKNQPETKIEQSKTAQKPPETKDAIIQRVNTQNIQSKQKIEEKIVSSEPKTIIKFSDKINDAQSNEIKDLIKRISREKDKDPEEKPEKNEPLIENKEMIKEAETISTANEEEKKSTIKSTETKEQNEIGEDDIEALKNLISKISQSPNKEEKLDKKLKAKKPEKSDSQKEITTLISEIKPEQTEQPKETIKSTNIIENDSERDISNIISEIKPNEKKEITKNELEQAKKLEEKKEAKKSFWSNISKNIKTTSDSQKINDLSNKDSILKKSELEEKIQSGILQSKREDNKDEEKDKENELLKTYYDEGYISPAQRLASGKQELYSSISKKVKLREEKNEIEAMKNANEIKGEQKVITKDEEYKKLKKNIIQKYNVKLFSLPWKKIIVLTIFVLFLVGGVYSFILKKFVPTLPGQQPIISTPAISGNEIEEFKMIEKELIISKKEIRGSNELNELVEINADAIFSSDQNIQLIKLLVVDNDTDKNLLPLEEALDAIGIINIAQEKNNFPEGFLDLTTNNYNLFVLKTKKQIRYGLAIKTNDAQSLSFVMEKWEKEVIPNKKMAMVFKPLFIDSASQEDQWKPFSKANYGEITINYVHLIDGDTALNYFIHDNILIVTTSKDNAFTMANLLIKN